MKETKNARRGLYIFLEKRLYLKIKILSSINDMTMQGFISDILVKHFEKNKEVDQYLDKDKE